MTRDEQVQLAQLAAQDGPVAAVHAVRAAFEWAVAALSAAGDDPLLALGVVFELDEALRPAAHLHAALPRLLAAAEPGRSVADAVRTRADELDTLSRKVADARRQHDELAGIQADLEARAAEHAQLVTRIGELTRLRRLADGVDELHAQRAGLEAEIARIGGDVEQAEVDLAATAGRLVTVTAEKLAQLQASTQAALEQAAALHAELEPQIEAERNAVTALERETERLAAELADAQTRHATLAEERNRLFAAVQRHIDADMEIAQALARAEPRAGVGSRPIDIETVRSALESVSRTVHDLDEALRHALEAGAERLAAEHAPRRGADT